MEIAETETSQHTRGTPVLLVLHRIGGELGEHCRPPHRRNHAYAWKSEHFQWIKGRPSPPPHCPHNENAWKPMHFKWSGPLGSPTPPPKQCRCFKIYVIPMNQGPPRTPRPHSNFWGEPSSKSIEMRRKSKKSYRKLYEIIKIVWTKKTC